MCAARIDARRALSRNKKSINQKNIDFSSAAFFSDCFGDGVSVVVMWLSYSVLLFLSSTLCPQRATCAKRESNIPGDRHYSNPNQRKLLLLGPSLQKQKSSTESKSQPPEKPSIHCQNLPFVSFPRKARNRHTAWIKIQTSETPASMSDVRSRIV